LEDVNFAVETRPLFVNVGSNGGSRFTEVAQNRAVVRCATGQVLGVVGRDYYLLTNAEALELALTCCLSLFPGTQSSEWSISAVDAPLSGTWCAVDLQHASRSTDYPIAKGLKHESYGSFVRVTNSYNTARALSFHAGFYRKVCSNGLILPQSVISFKFSHSRRDLSRQIEFRVADPELGKLSTRFGDCLAALHQCSVPLASFGSMARAILRIPQAPSRAWGPVALQEWDALSARISALSDRYAEELGDNAYAVLNVVTDLASRPSWPRVVRRDRHSLQRLAGAWADGFGDAVRAEGFSLSAYFEKLAAAVPPKDSPFAQN
jgi:hypothetical protein